MAIEEFWDNIHSDYILNFVQNIFLNFFAEENDYRSLEGGDSSGEFDQTLIDNTRNI